MVSHSKQGVLATPAIEWKELLLCTIIAASVSMTMNTMVSFSNSKISVFIYLSFGEWDTMVDGFVTEREVVLLDLFLRHVQRLGDQSSLSDLDLRPVTQSITRAKYQLINQPIRPNSSLPDLNHANSITVNSPCLISTKAATNNNRVLLAVYKTANTLNPNENFLFILESIIFYLDSHLRIIQKFQGQITLNINLDSKKARMNWWNQ